MVQRWSHGFQVIVLGCWFANSSCCLVKCLINTMSPEGLWLGFVNHMNLLCLLDQVCESRLGLNKAKIGGFYCRDLRKLIPLVKRKWNSFILCGGYGLSFDLIHDLNVFNRLLLCSLNPGISLIFKSRYLQPRVLPLPLWSNLYFHLFRNHLFEIKSLNLHSINPWTITRHHYSIAGVRVL